MCQCGVWRRPNQSTMGRIRTAFAALKTPYYRASVIILRGKKSGHIPWQMDHQKARDAKKRSTETRPIHLYSGPMANEENRTSQLVHGWTEEWVNYLDYTSKIDISHSAPYRQRLRYESTLCIRNVDSNKQAGPLCQRPDYKSSADALVSIQRAQGKGVSHIPVHWRTRQNNTLDPAVRQRLEWLSFNWKTYFSSSSSSTWTERSTWWSSSRWDHQLVGSATTMTTPESRTDYHKETCTVRSERKGLNCSQVHLHPDSICGLTHFSDFLSFLAAAMNATVGVQITLHRTHAHTRTFSRCARHM